MADGAGTTNGHQEKPPYEQILPQSNQDVTNGNGQAGEFSNAHRPRKGLVRIKTSGESGRRGIHPLHFFTIIWQSTSRLSRAVNVLWPFVPAALAVFFNVEGHHTLKFSLAYIAMIPPANLVGFAGQQLAMKLPHVFGVLVETTIGSLVEIILFNILLFTPDIGQSRYYIIRAAILGSILATMLLCLGLCFFASGLIRESATFDSAVGEIGTGLLLMAGLGLAIPTIYQHSIYNTIQDYGLDKDQLDARTTQVSRAVAVLLLIAYVVYVIFQTRTHHGIFDAIFEHDEHRDADRHKDARKPNLTFTECILALAISVGLVAIIAYALVREITPIVEENGISDPFMGLILVPLVEKAAEHLTAIDEAWDNQMNLALSHCIGATIQTALLNAPLIVIIAWGQNLPLDLSFEIFEIAVLIIAIITVGNYLRDQKSDYLEGFLCIVTYIAIAAAAFYFPNKHEESGVDG